jgi:outer membrane translocation and assembly module TamA
LFQENILGGIAAKLRNGAAAPAGIAVAIAILCGGQGARAQAPADGGAMTPATPAQTSSQPTTQPDGQQQPAGARVPTYTQGQSAASATPTAGAKAAKTAISSPLASTPGLRAVTGLTIGAVDFRGVERSSLDPLPARLPVQPGMKLDPQKVRESLRRLYATGLYQGIDVQATRQGSTITLIFNGAPQLFFGRVTVRGVKDDRLSAQLVRAAKLSPGSPYSETKLTEADTSLQDTLQQYGYYQGKLSRKSIYDTPDRQVDIQYQVVTGKVARVGDVKVEGDSGMTLERTIRNRTGLSRMSTFRLASSTPL